MTVVLSDVDAAWLAAVVDSEGCIGMDKPKHMRPDYIYPRVQVGSTCREFLEHAQEITGLGTIRPVKLVAGRKPMFSWVVRGQAAVDLLGQLLDHLIIKRERAIEALASDFALAGDLR